MLKFTKKDEHQIHSSLSGRNWAPIQVQPEDVAEYNALRSIGIGFDHGYVAEIVNALQLAATMDNNDVGIAPAPGSLQSTAAIPSLVQFLQAWMPGFVNFITAARKIDE